MLEAEKLSLQEYFGDLPGPRVEARCSHNLLDIIIVQRERREGEQTYKQTAYYISSLEASADFILQATRRHWSIENSCHWVLDVVFGKDHSHIRQGEGAENMAILRAVALNLLKRDKSKSSLRQKRFRAAMDNDFLLQLLHLF